jgi:hypothetical protein
MAGFARRDPDSLRNLGEDGKKAAATPPFSCLNVRQSGGLTRIPVAHLNRSVNL